MSLERILTTLAGFGLSREEAYVYVYLAKAGPSKAKDLSSGLRMTKQQLYPALNRLKKKGIITSKSEHVALFSALAFEELLNIYIRVNAEKAIVIRENREAIIKIWLSVTKKDKS